MLEKREYHAFSRLMTEGEVEDLRKMFSEYLITEK